MGDYHQKTKVSAEYFFMNSNYFKYAKNITLQPDRALARMIAGEYKVSALKTFCNFIQIKKNTFSKRKQITVAANIH